MTCFSDSSLLITLQGFGAWCALLPASGILTTTGALQAYLLDHQLKGHGESEVGWIFSVFAFLFFFCGILGGPYFQITYSRAIFKKFRFCF